MSEGASALERCLLGRQGDCRLALPIHQVIETLRPLAVDAVPDLPEFVRGLAIVRGGVVPVVDAGVLLGSPGTAPTRWITLRVGDRRVALAVESIEGVRDLPRDGVAALPPLLGGARSDLVAAIGVLDARLLVVLRTARILDDAAWAALDAHGGDA